MEVAQIRNIRFHAVCAVHTVMTKTDLSHVWAKKKKLIWATFACSVNVSSVFEFTHLFLFSPSSGLIVIEGIGGDFKQRKGLQTCYKLQVSVLALNSVGCWTSRSRIRHLCSRTLYTVVNHMFFLFFFIHCNVQINV